MVSPEALLSGRQEEGGTKAFALDKRVSRACQEQNSPIDETLEDRFLPVHKRGSSEGPSLVDGRKRILQSFGSQHPPLEVRG